MNSLVTAGDILNVPSTYLMITLLSFGNSASGKNFLLKFIIINISLDLSLNCALAKSGYGEMGIAGSIAGPLFNLLIGLGTTALKKISSNNW